MVTETSKSSSSNRGHAIYTLQIETVNPNSDICTISTLQFVDLAAMENIKSISNPTLQKEAKHINKSLHFLEQVLIGLKSRAMGEEVFIPYRSSLLTMALRNSLETAYKVRIIATIKGDKDEINESVSTCRFAQRVGFTIDLDSLESQDQTPDIQKSPQGNTELISEPSLFNQDSENPPI